MLSKLKIIDKVYLLIKNQKIRKKDKKSDSIKVRQFFIKNKKKVINYDFEIPKNTKVY